MTDEHDWEMLARYVSGESAAAEQAEVERWASSDPSAKALLATLDRQWRAAAPSGESDVNAAWARLRSRLELGEPGAVPRVLLHDAHRRRRFLSVPIMRLAAAIVLVVGVGIVWRNVVSRPQSTGTVTVAAGVEILTGVGERRNIDLPDGSHVVLGAMSTLRLGEAFGATDRPVYLEGQALFSVTHDAARPFVVHAAGTLSEDLGTEFEVRAYPGDSAVRVVVTEGEVALRRAGAAPEAAALLRPRDVARLSATGEAEVLHDQDVARLLAWTGGELVFDDASLAQVAEELQRWYDIEVRIPDAAVRNRRYTGSFAAEDLGEVLRVIEASLGGIRIQREGRDVTISAGAPSANGLTAPAPAPAAEVGA